MSVHKLRARLSAGNPTTLSPHLNAVEAELVRAGLAHMTMPDLPELVVEHIRAQ